MSEYPVLCKHHMKSYLQYSNRNQAARKHNIQVYQCSLLVEER